MNKKIKSVRLKVPLPDCKQKEGEKNESGWKFNYDENGYIPPWALIPYFYFTEEAILRNPDVFEVEYDEPKMRPITFEEIAEISECWFRTTTPLAKRIIIIDESTKSFRVGGGNLYYPKDFTEYSYDLKRWHKMEKEITE